MNGDPLLVTLASAAGMAAAGFIFGLAYFEALRRSVEIVVTGHGWLGPTAFLVTRVAGATLVFVAMAQLGLIAPIAGLAGFIAARSIAVGAARRAG